MDADDFTPEEGQFLKQLANQQHRKLSSIWKVYELIKQKDDMIHSLRVFFDIEKKQ